MSRVPTITLPNRMLVHHREGAVGGDGRSEVLFNKNHALLEFLPPFLKSDKIPLFLYSTDLIRLLDDG